MVALSSDATIEETKQMFLNNHFSRFPVYEKDMDNIIGMITNKDFSGSCAASFRRWQRSPRM